MAHALTELTREVAEALWARGALPRTRPAVAPRTGPELRLAIFCSLEMYPHKLGKTNPLELLRLALRRFRALEVMTHISEEAQSELSSRDVPGLHAQLAQYQARLEFWYQRLWELEGIDIDHERMEVRYRNRSIDLTKREYQLLVCLSWSAYTSTPTSSSAQVDSFTWPGGSHWPTSSCVSTSPAFGASYGSWSCQPSWRIDGGWAIASSSPDA